jgi:hypothetical protein
MGGRLMRAVWVWAVVILCGYSALSTAIGIALAERSMRFRRKPLDDAAGARVRAQAAGSECAPG